jgi:hypothetical protein
MQRKVSSFVFVYRLSAVCYIICLDKKCLMMKPRTTSTKKENFWCFFLQTFGPDPLQVTVSQWPNFDPISVFFNMYRGGGVQLGPLGTAATNRPIVPAPGDYDDGAIGGMIGRGNRSTRRKPAPMPLCPPQTPHAARTRTQAAAMGSQRLTAWATARAYPISVLPFPIPARSFSWADYSSELKMGATVSLEMLMTFYQNLRCHVTEDSNRHIQAYTKTLVSQFNIFQT